MNLIRVTSWSRHFSIFPCLSPSFLFTSCIWPVISRSFAFTRLWACCRPERLHCKNLIFVSRYWLSLANSSNLSKNKLSINNLSNVGTLELSPDACGDTIERKPSSNAAVGFEDDSRVNVNKVNPRSLNAVVKMKSSSSDPAVGFDDDTDVDLNELNRTLSKIVVEVKDKLRVIANEMNSSSQKTVAEGKDRVCDAVNEMNPCPLRPVVGLEDRVRIVVIEKKLSLLRNLKWDEVATATSLFSISARSLKLHRDCSLKILDRLPMLDSSKDRFSLMTLKRLPSLKVLSLLFLAAIFRKKVKHDDSIRRGHSDSLCARPRWSRIICWLNAWELFWNSETLDTREDRWLCQVLKSLSCV